MGLVLTSCRLCTAASVGESGKLMFRYSTVDGVSVNVLVGGKLSF